MTRIGAYGATLMIALVSCATPIEPQLIVHSEAPIIGPLYLIAAKEKIEIAESLQRAGVELTDRLMSATAVVRVTLGVEKNSKGCGAYSNVKFALRRDSRTIIEITAAGWTGRCEPLIYDPMSHSLAEAMKGNP